MSVDSSQWDSILGKVKAGNPALFIWLEKTKIIFSGELNKYIIEVPDTLHKQTLSSKYKTDVFNILKENTGQEIDFDFDIQKETGHIKETSSKIVINERQISLPLEPRPEHIPNLNSKYKFENFIIGDNNRFAQAASMAVAESPGQTYNPLFIYGGVGLGKTHLLHAIGNFVFDNKPSAKILIITSEKFLFEVVQKIRENKMDEFREKYRNVDLLLVDDIQFLQRGESAREEFFHTFNELYNLNKQIVATSDSPPHELRLEERLRSRFSAGLIVDIQPPTFETRIAILRQKAKEFNRNIPDIAIAYIAEHIVSNIRDLSGTLLTLIALAQQSNQEINLDIAKQVVKMKIPDIELTKKIGIDSIQKTVADYFNLKIQDLSSKKRPENIAKARQIAMYITRNMTDYSLVQIGQYFGGKDHTTVMHAIDKIEKLIKEDDKFKAVIDELIMRIKQ